MNKTTRRALQFFCAGSALALSAGVAAQEEATTEVDLGTERVVGVRLYDMLPSEVTGGYSVDAVTVGTKVPAALRDIPQSVSVVTHEAIEDQNFTTLDQLAGRTPGVRVMSNDSGRSSIYARGYEYDAYSIDGLPAPMSSLTGSVPSLAAFDRVEIMRGPSGLFNSTSELGGIINLVRKRPTDTFQGEVFGSLGSESDYRAGVDVSGPLDSQGRVRGRLVVEQTQQPEWVDHNENRQTDVYAALDIDLSAATELSLGLIHNARDITVNNGQPLGSEGELLYGHRSNFYGADWNYFDSESWDAIAELTHRFANRGYGRLAARYSDRSSDANYAFGGTALDDQGRLGVAGFAGVADQQTLAVDASYTQAFGKASEFVVGVDYKNYDTESQQGRSRSVSPVRLTKDELNQLRYVDILAAAEAGQAGYRFSDSRSELEETGAYGKLVVRPIDSLALIGGARVSHFDTRYDDHVAGNAASLGDTVITPYAGLVYDLDWNHSLYASYSKVFKPQTRIGADGDLIDPREGKQYEVGIKGRYLGGDLNARISAFSLTDSHRAAASSDLGVSYYVDSGEVKVTGAELEIIGSLTPQWDLIFGYTYMDVEVKSESRGDFTFSLMPKNLVSLWSKYSFAGGALNGLHVGGGMTAMSDFSTSSGIEAPGYAVFDAMLGYDFTNQLSAQLNVYNIFDRDYYMRVGGEGTFNFPGQPARAVGTLRYAF